MVKGPFLPIYPPPPTKRAARASRPRSRSRLRSKGSDLKQEQGHEAAATRRSSLFFRALPPF